ncbi:type-F conjugative transfer system pilin assembly protein TrbC [Ramlibacter humi]|nr:type-F conjugative transfer system pilin assembly protein TrbC [Ramlibacter humi]
MPAVIDRMRLCRRTKMATCAAMLGLLAASAQADGAGQFPAIEEVLRAAERKLGRPVDPANPASKPVPNPASRTAATAPAPSAGTLPGVPPRAAPQGAPDPAAQGAKLAAMLKQYGVKQELPTPVLHGKLYVAISFSMPEESLRRLFAQARAAGATVILRGLHRNSGKATQERFAQLLAPPQGVKAGGRPQPGGGMSLRASPKSFERFGIREVPAFVLVPPRGAQDDCRTPACPGYGDFAVATGDVSVSYAMEAIGRARPDLRPAAEFFARRAAWPTGETRR